MLAIDQSTSATKAVLFDLSGSVLDRASREHQQFYPRAGWVEHDAQEIWRNTLLVTSELLDRLPGNAAEVACVSIANQRESIVVFDRRTGIPLAPVIVWQCGRGAPLCAAQRELGRAPEIEQRTGLRVDSYFSASKLQWLMRERPDVAAGLLIGEALIGTVDTYLIYRMTGGAVFATDHTNASRTLLYNLRRREWDAQLCEWWQIPVRALAQIRASDAFFGETNLAGALPRTVPICGVMGDSQAALFSHRCLDVGSVKVTLGTGSSVLLNTGAELLSTGGGAVRALAWMRGERPTYALEGIINSAGSTLTWLRDQLGILEDTADSEAVAREVCADDPVYLVPAFSGLGAPYWRDDARAAIVGLSAHSDRRHVIRAALDSIAYQLRDVIEMMRCESGLEIDAIRVDGGATTNGYLMQFVADIVRVQLQVSEGSDGAASGAALMGVTGAKLVSSTEAFVTDGDPVIYRPVLAEERARAHYAGWQRAVRQVLSGAGEAV